MELQFLLNVPVVGSAIRPQLHYYVGVDFYFKQRVSRFRITINTTVLDSSQRIDIPKAQVVLPQAIEPELFTLGLVSIYKKDMLIDYG